MTNNHIREDGNNHFQEDGNDDSNMPLASSLGVPQDEIISFNLAWSSQSTMRRRMISTPLILLKTRPRIGWPMLRTNVSLGHCVSFNVPTLVVATSLSYPVQSCRQSVRIDSPTPFALSSWSRRGLSGKCSPNNTETSILLALDSWVG
jgi:hypothetical protein